MKETRGRYLAHSARAKIRPYFLYSGYRDFASSGRTKFPVQREGSNESLPGLCSAMRLRRPALARCVCLLGICLACAVLSACPATESGSSGIAELSRTIRTWEFLPVVGTRAGLFGNETGTIRSLGLSPEDLSRFSPDLPRRRSRAARGESRAHADGSSRVRVNPVRRRFFSRARNALRPGERSRGGHSARG